MPKAAPARSAPTKKGKDPNAPKRALSAFMYFSTENRSKILEENPGIKFGDVGKLLGARWKALDAKGKIPYEKKANADKERYAKDKVTYENGGTVTTAKKAPVSHKKAPAPAPVEASDDDDEDSE